VQRCNKLVYSIQYIINGREHLNCWCSLTAHNEITNAVKRLDVIKTAMEKLNIDKLSTVKLEIEITII